MFDFWYNFNYTLQNIFSGIFDSDFITMKYPLLAIVFFLNLGTIQSQQKPSQSEIATLPEWAREMYSDYPNAFKVDSLFRTYYSEVPFKKSFHSQYYKRWRRGIANFIDYEGEVHLPTQQGWTDLLIQHKAKQSENRSANWSALGPFFVSNPQFLQGKTQSNIYSLAISPSNPQIMYAGTEPGEIYRSSNGGNSWDCISLDDFFGYGVTALAVHPGNSDIAFAGGNLGIFKTTDAGNQWVSILPDNQLGVNEIWIQPGQGSVVLAATDKGLYRSTDTGNNWVQLFTEKSYDLAANPNNASILYLVKNDPSQSICSFFRSTDMGSTWAMQTNGWYTSADPARFDGGARLAVSAADPNRVYAYLIGESKPNDYGFIGVFKSTDAGQSWTLPNGPTGGPYTATHPNLAYGYPNWTYHQGFYNCALMASQTNADQILIGGLNLWRSDDGGATFSSVAGYVGGPLDMHVDMQDFRAGNGDYWISTDGGIYRSTDFFNSQPDFKMQGLRGSDYWGFGSGWNEDVLVGGLYHNGNLAHHENYGPGNFLSLGGAEDPTGYVNPGINRKTYHSDLGGVVIPYAFGDPLTYFSVGMFPNQSYWAAESSEMEFHPNCYSIAYIGKENKLWKTMNGGASYSLIHQFGSNALDRIHYIEIASSNPNVIYLNQQPNSGSQGQIWKSTDGGISWASLSLPPGNSRRMLLSINPIDENELWIAYPDGSNGNKVFKTNNGGTSWSNLSSSILNNESPQALVHIAGTNGAIYLFTQFSAYYRNNNSPGWIIDNSGLPTYCNSNIARPFYRDGKIRLASYGKGIWEKPLDEPSILPIARISVNTLNQTALCEPDSFYFEDYSFLNHLNASWEWTFQNGQPSTSTQRNPVVYFSQDGNHMVTLKIQDNQGNISRDTLIIGVSRLNPSNQIAENFEGSFPPSAWRVVDQNQSGQWTKSPQTGSFGQSSSSALFANFDIDSQGSFDDLQFIFSTANAIESYLTFDVAYTAYASNYSDTLEVLISSDCGQSFQSLYKKGGADLSTAPFDPNYFVPTANQWRTDTISLQNYLQNNKLMIAFRNWGYWGNNLYIDQVNITGQVNSNPTVSSNQTCSIYPNPICSGQSITLEIPGLNQSEKAKVTIVNSQGKEIFSFKSGRQESVLLPLENWDSGLYLVNISTSQRIWNLPLILSY